MRNILITNDDGIEADGIARLAECAKAFGEVWVVAPKDQNSALSHSITLHRPLTFRPHSFPVQGVHAFSVDGTPADCVRVGSLSIMPKKPDAVFSGINYGYNIATDIQYSATAGAAFEGVFQGYPAIAFSENAGKCHEVTDRYLREIMEELLEEPFVPGEILNVNFPGCALSECRGIERDVAVSGIIYYEDHYEVLKSFPDGGAEVMVEGVHTPRTEEGTDYGAILSNHVAIGRVRNIG
ncbi:MAG: 5'/3'-nucleotidase SurE [Lachnospiraceae bacterium]|nr:5'/3'-nucleotidase SurE [Lachnospiraceae bacterium]